MAVIFPDAESVVVAYLKDVLDNDVYVATKKPAADAAQPSKQVIINVAYNEERWYVTKLASATLEVYAEGSVQATELALLVEAHIRGCVGDPVKRATVRVGPVRVTDAGPLEKRMLDVELVIAGSQL